MEECRPSRVKPGGDPRTYAPLVDIDAEIPSRIRRSKEGRGLAQVQINEEGKNITQE